jgi:hypothetical protein
MPAFHCEARAFSFGVRQLSDKPSKTILPKMHLSLRMTASGRT